SKSSSYAWYTTCSVSNASCIMIMFGLVRVDRKWATCVVCASLCGYTLVHDMTAWILYASTGLVNLTGSYVLVWYASSEFIKYFW
ncbi:hypothetical protein DFJ58DRAFT_791243, partial [Suillus subalutaceus]|uniref:uncharacterized protein n=1 Tax=Suillus subalutaceus TaxID=48586 RepID=UPI001B86DCF3